MNNSLINRNTTILVLVILVLGFIYTNLESNQSMTGGAVDCEAFIPIVKKLIAKDTLYSYTIGSTPGFIIYIILILILTYLGFIFVKYEITYSGSPVIAGTGYTMLDWAKGAFYKFYTVRNDMYFYKDTNAPGASGTTTKQDEEQFTGLIETLRSPAYRDTVHNFCEKVQPCSKVTPCACPGATACQSNVQHFANVNIEHFLEHNSNTANPAKKAIALKQKHAKKFFGIIPKCCCVHREKFIKADTPKKKIGDANPNYYIGDQAEEIGCGTGTRTVAGINSTLNSPGVNADGSIAPANPDDECKDVDCSNEPPYAQLLVDAFDGTGKINPAYLESAKAKLSNIIQNTPAADIAAAFQNSTYNSGPSASVMSVAFSTKNLLATPGIGNSNNIMTLTPSPYDAILVDEVEANKNFDPATNIATMPPPPDKAANGPGGFTSRLSKSAKKIKKNKK
jgi:hypothetical protein